MFYCDGHKVNSSIITFVCESIYLMDCLWYSMKMCDLIKLYTCMYIYVYVSIVIYATKVSFSHAQGKYLIDLHPWLLYHSSTTHGSTLGILRVII